MAKFEKLNKFGKRLHDKRGLHCLDEWDDCIFSINNFLEVVKEAKQELPDIDNEKYNHCHHQMMNAYTCDMEDWKKKWFGEGSL